MSLISFTPRRFTDSSLFLKEINGQKLLIKTYLNDDSDSRRKLESQKNLHWSACGFNVPKLVDIDPIDIELGEISDPYLVMEFIHGVNLSDYLQDRQVSPETKLKTLSEIFEINHTRHLLALANEDDLLIHTDPNTDNIILSDGRIFFIDFEHISKPLDITTAVAREVATFARRAIKNLGVGHTGEVITLLLVAYQYNGAIMDKVEELTFGRSFQLLHRFKDHVKKRKDPELVSRYDVAETIKLLRSNPASA
jgi:tRNA A-37 threonylcarbamoyl transferase component Bud32